MSTTFKDITGTEWNLRITIANYMDLKERNVVDLSTIFSEEDWLNGLFNMSNMTPYLGVLHELCKDQYEANGVADSNDFFKRLDGAALEASSEAFIGAVILFSPAHRQETLREMYQTMQLGLEKTGQVSKKRIEDHREMTLNHIEKTIDDAMSNSLNETMEKKSGMQPE